MLRLPKSPFYLIAAAAWIGAAGITGCGKHKKHNASTSPDATDGAGDLPTSSPIPTPAAQTPVLDDKAVAAIPTPVKNWRIAATAVQASQNVSSLALLTGSNPEAAVSWQFNLADAADTASFYIKVPAQSGGNAMLTFGGLQLRADRNVTISRAQETSPGVVPTGGWSVIYQQNTTAEMQRLVFAPTDDSWLQVSIKGSATDDYTQPFTMTQLGLYTLAQAGAKDYWLMVGGGLEVTAFRNSTFKAAMRTAFPGSDPVLFNAAVGGATSTSIAANMQALLDAHPEATYVLVHMGGLDVDNRRPYPGGASTLKANLTNTIKAIQAAGKVPVVSRVTFRNYQTAPLVPPEENGAGPYVTAIYDPVIQSLTPAFYDFANKAGFIDGYGYFKANLSELSNDDGIHLTAQGSTNWLNMWVIRAGRVAYKAAPSNGFDPF